jgi:hypothetical protein
LDLFGMMMAFGVKAERLVTFQLEMNRMMIWSDIQRTLKPEIGTARLKKDVGLIKIAVN